VGLSEVADSCHHRVPKNLVGNSSVQVALIDTPPCKKRVTIDQFHCQRS